MIKCNIYGVSDWPEDIGKHFIIYKNKVFGSENDAIRQASNEYNGIEIFVEILEDNEETNNEHRTRT